MSDDIERVIRRDLDRLPVFPEERWLPLRPTRVGVAMLLTRAVLSVVFVGLAVVASFALLRIRGELGGSTLASPQPTAATTTAIPASTVVSRQSVLAQVRALTGIIRRLQRYEAKLVSSVDLAATPQFRPPSGSLFWIVAASGDVICSFCVNGTEPMHSAIFWFDPDTGAVLGGGQGVPYWPEGFDALPDRRIAPGSQTVVGSVIAVRGNVIELEPASGSGPRQNSVFLQADENTAYAWEAGLAGGNVLTLDELPRLGDPQILVSVTFDPVAKPDGSYRLESLATGINTK